MSRFNAARLRHAVTSPIRSVRTLGGSTAEGAPGYLRRRQGELFLLAVPNMVGENTFYESASGRDNRYAELVRAVTRLDPEWTARFLGWLRRTANMRSAALVGAAEFTRARLGHWQDRSYPASLVFPVRAHEPLSRAVERWKSDGYFIGSGTDTAGAVRTHYARHDRVVILTDEQATGTDVGAAIPASVPLYTWNLAGYRFGHAPSGSHNRHVFGGLTDPAFSMIALLEAGSSGDWPF